MSAGGLTTLAQADRPKSGDIHIVEHIRKIEGGKKLEVLVTFDDPKVYTSPGPRGCSTTGGRTSASSSTSARRTTATR